MKSFTIASFLMLVGVAVEARLTHNDLYQALNTRRPVWMVARSYHRPDSGEQNKCVYSLQIELTQYDYEFYQYHRHGSTREQKRLYGGLTTDPATQEPALDVSERKGYTGQLYTLRFWDKENNCGVLTVGIKGRQECELYAWDEAARNPSSLSDCYKQYSILCANRYEVFESGCESLN